MTNVFQPDHSTDAAELGLSGPDDYFNSGVLLLDLAALRRDGCTEALREVALAVPASVAGPTRTR